MKKILSLLTAIILTASSTTSVISCGSNSDKTKEANIKPSNLTSNDIIKYLEGKKVWIDKKYISTKANEGEAKTAIINDIVQRSYIPSIDTKYLTFENKTLASGDNYITVTATKDGKTATQPSNQPSKELNVFIYNSTKTSKEIGESLEGKKISIENKYANTQTIDVNTKAAIVDKIVLNNFITREDSPFLSFQNVKLKTGDNYVVVTVKKDGQTFVQPTNQPNKELNVFVQSSDPSTGPKVIPNLSNYDMNSDKENIKPIDPTTPIDYNKTKYTPWFDDGFNWYQFLEGGGQNANAGDMLINHILDNNNNVVNLGFITAFNDKAPKNNGLTQTFTSWLKNNVNFDWRKQTVPTVGGILPLWFSNWTDVNGSKTPDGASKESWNKVYRLLNKIRQGGKDYTFSFGGWNGDSIAMDAYLKGYSAENLALYYEKIIDFFNLKTIDFDIEGTDDGKVDDFGNQHTKEQGVEAKKLRYRAIQLLKENQKYKNTYITLTFPTFMNKLADANDSTTPMILSLLKNNVVNKINLMAFDYFNIPYGKRISAPGEMAIYGMSAANAMANLLRDNGISNPYSRIILTGMPGPEDSQNLVWTLTDQALLENFAYDKKLGGLSMWSSLYDMSLNFKGTTVGNGRNFDLWHYTDMLSGTGKKDALASGLATTPYAWSNIFGLIGQNRKYNFNGKTAMPTKLWQQVQSLKISIVSDVNNITQADIDRLCNSNFVFADHNGFGDAWTNSNETKAFLQAELNFAAWSSDYTQKNLT